jgi:hypothetical protein
VHGEAEIRGHRRTYIGSAASKAGMEATLQQFDALRSPGRTIRGHVDGFVGRMMAAVLEVAAVLQSYGCQFVNDQARARRGGWRTCSGKKIAKAMKRTIGPTAAP